MVIQVLISGRSRTEVVTVHLDSPGKALYRAIQERGGVLAALVHGVNIIRHGVSLREKGLHHLSTVFVLPVMGEGGGKTRLGKHLGAGKREKGGREGGRGHRAICTCNTNSKVKGKEKGGGKDLGMT